MRGFEPVNSFDRDLIPWEIPCIKILDDEQPDAVVSQRCAA